MSVQKLKLFAENHDAAALIMSEENVKYYTGFSSTNGWLIVTKEKSFFLTDSRYVEAAASEIKTVDEILETKGFKATIVPLIKKLGILKLFIEQERTTLSRFEQLKKELDGISYAGVNIVLNVNHRSRFSLLRRQ